MPKLGQPGVRGGLVFAGKMKGLCDGVAAGFVRSQLMRVPPRCPGSAGPAYELLGEVDFDLPVDFLPSLLGHL